MCGSWRHQGRTLCLTTFLYHTFKPTLEHKANHNHTVRVQGRCSLFSFLRRPVMPSGGLSCKGVLARYTHIMIWTAFAFAHGSPQNQETHCMCNPPKYRPKSALDSNLSALEKTCFRRGR